MTEIRRIVKELKEASQFVWSVEFWRMGLYWTFSLLFSYFHSLFFPHHSKSYPRCSPTTTTTTTTTTMTTTTSKSGSRLVCIITGATSVPGKAAAFVLSMEVSALFLTVAEIKNQNKDAQLKALQIDKDTVSGKCFMLLEWYPCAHICQYYKLFLLLFSYELHRKLGSMGNFHHVSVVAVVPGAVETDIMREVPLCLSYLAVFVLKLLGLLQMPKNGVCSILDASLAPPEISGQQFFGGKGRVINSKLSYNPKLVEELWTTSCDLF